MIRSCLAFLKFIAFLAVLIGALVFPPLWFVFIVWAIWHAAKHAEATAGLYHTSDR